ncbi:hypothetical protein ACIBK9_11835 [Nonomuraea sp. NPDC050227]|uniref:hypothetical protein n=1 Tax=Nonomuraea sp. NPDC050227 TaxID=3364360 RepID=UPI0037B41F5A
MHTRVLLASATKRHQHRLRRRTRRDGLGHSRRAARCDLDLLHVTDADTQLIPGAAGAVGTVAVQPAVARGATVTGTTSAADHDYRRSLAPSLSPTATGSPTASATSHLRAST